MPWCMRLAVAGVAVDLMISANLLTLIGLPYVTEGGALPLKIHPGTYLLGCGFLVFLVGRERPNRVIWCCGGGDANIAIFLIALLACIAYALMTTGMGNIVVLLDTFLPAGLLAAVMNQGQSHEQWWLRRVLQWGIFANAMLALGEASVHANLVPLYLNDAAFHAASGEFRPTALYDHPLTGGVMTMIGLALVPRQGFGRLTYALLLSAGLLAFGGRVAVAVAVLRMATVAAVEMASRVLRRDRTAIHLLLRWGALMLLGLGAIGTVCAAGLGDRLLGHLYWDPSAQVRLAQWDLINELNIWQIAFGTPRNELLGSVNMLWLNAGVEVIENFWLLMFAALGIAGFPIFLASLYGLLAWCWRRSDLRGRALVLSVLAVASTSNSLGRKSAVLVGLVAAIASLPARQNRHLKTVNSSVLAVAA